MKAYLTKSNIFYLSFIIILLFTFFSSIVNGYSKESWGITEFLINYQGGFVRRGLLGEIILYVYNLTGINPYITIIAISVPAYIILIWFFIKSFIRNGYSLFILPFVFFLGNPIINDFWVRKDILIILVFILTMHFSIKKSNWNLILVNLFLIFGLLTHEGIAFFCFPILFLILFSNNKLKYNFSFTKTSFISITQILPSIFVFLSVLHFKGSQEIASQIWESWKPINFPIQAIDNGQIPAAIDGVAWTLKRGLSLTLNTLSNFDCGIYAPVAWILIILTIYYVLTNTHKLNFKIFNYNTNKKINKTNISNILIFQLLTIIPLFILGWDYGRWVFFWTTSSFVILFLVPEKKMAIVFPEITSTISTKVNRILDLFLSKINILLLCILIGFPSFSWSLSSSVKSNSIVFTLKFISKIVHQILLFVKEII